MSLTSANDLGVGISGGWEDGEVGYLVGRGATGSVYRAICNGQQVAVKVHIHQDTWEVII